MDQHRPTIADQIAGFRATPSPSTRESVFGSGHWWKLSLAIAVAMVLAFGLLFAFRALLRPLEILFAAIIIAQALAPIVDRLAQRMPRGLAIGAVYLALAGFFTGIAFLVIPTLTTQAQEVISDAPQLLDRLEGRLAAWGLVENGDLLEVIQQRAQGSVDQALTVPLVVVTVLTELLLIIFLSIYWLITAQSMKRFALSLFPDRKRDQADEVLNAMGHTIGGYVRAQAITGVIIATIVYVGLLLIGMPYPLVLALLAGVGELVPVLGPIIAGIPAVLLALLESPTMALIVLAFYVILQQLESNVIAPHLVKSQADIPPLLVIFAIFAGGSIGGVLGALIAIPLAGALKVFVVRVLAPAIRRQTNGHSEAPIASSPSD